MPEIISPPPEEWDDLPTPLTAGERRVAEFFVRHLPAGWEIYVQPHLNGLQPDFVLLHPDIGVAVYEVKDWNPGSTTYRVDGRTGVPTLMAQYRKAERPISLAGNDNPFLRVRSYKHHIHRMSTGAIAGPLGNEYAGYGRITAGVIFTVGDSRFWNDLSRPFRQPREPVRYYPVLGEDALNSGLITWVLPETANPRQDLMNDQIAESLRLWLRESDYVRQQREPLPILTDRQRRLVEDEPPSITRSRRVRGPAGSGKSLVLAARAAHLAMQGKSVLVVGFNITLSHYLHDLAVRRLRQLTHSREQSRAARKRMIFTHFHRWEGLQKDFPDSFRGLDAILVDEGQDFELSWWNELRDALKPGGEMMLVFDKTQDIYRRAGAWTPDAMTGGGFRGPWNELDVSYRCHGGLMPALEHFTDHFMRGAEVDLPRPAQPELTGLYPLSSRWVQIGQDADWITTCVDELQQLVNSLPEDSGPSDVVCLLPEHLEGFNFVTAAEERLRLRISHIFSEAKDPDIRQERSTPLKHAFWAGNGLLKAITIHSFKGWEARHLLVYIDDVWQGNTMPALFYTALTRLLAHTGGSSLSVVSSCYPLADFGRRFFDDFVELEGATSHDSAGLPF